MMRVLRLGRLLVKLKPLNQITAAFLRGMADVFWILVLAFLLLFMGSLLLTEWLRDSAAIPLEVKEKYYPSVPSTMLTLFKVFLNP